MPNSDHFGKNIVYNLCYKINISCYNVESS